MQPLYIDNHLLALLKPSNLLTQETESQKDSLEVRAKAFIKKEKNKPGKVFLHPISRLDKPVSGIVLFALTSKALSRMQEEQRQRKIKKEYLAWVEGTLKEKKETLTHFLEQGSHKAYVKPEGKKAILTYEVLEEKAGFSLVKIELLTGRYHQIRAQFSHIGHPILGDKKYGSTKALPRILLHHYRVEFIHPVKQEKIILEDKNGKERLTEFLFPLN